jgi:hypothetical protein
VRGASSPRGRPPNTDPRWACWRRRLLLPPTPQPPAMRHARRRLIADRSTAPDPPRSGQFPPPAMASGLPGADREDGCRQDRVVNTEIGGADLAAVAAHRVMTAQQPSRPFRDVAPLIPAPLGRSNVARDDPERGSRRRRGDAPATLEVDPDQPPPSTSSVRARSGRRSAPSGWLVACDDRDVPRETAPVNNRFGTSGTRPLLPPRSRMVSALRRASNCIAGDDVEIVEPCPAPQTNHGGDVRGTPASRFVAARPTSDRTLVTCRRRRMVGRNERQPRPLRSREAESEIVTRRRRGFDDRAAIGPGPCRA